MPLRAANGGIGVGTGTHFRGAKGDYGADACLPPELTRRAFRCRRCRGSDGLGGCVSLPGVDTPGFTMSPLAGLGWFEADACFPRR